MGITDIPIFSMLRSRMDWAQERQRVLAENVSNSDTPSYRAKDLVPLKFPEPAAPGQASVMNVALARTDSGHIGVSGQGTDYRTNSKTGYDVRPAGNAVNLEEEMMKVAANQVDYQAATALYTRSLGLIKTAIGKR